MRHLKTSSPIAAYAPSSFSKIESVYHKVNDGQIIIALTNKSEGPEFGTFMFLYSVNDAVAREKANAFLNDLLFAKANDLGVKFMKVSADNFVINGIVIGSKM